MFFGAVVAPIILIAGITVSGIPNPVISTFTALLTSSDADCPDRVNVSVTDWKGWDRMHIICETSQGAADIHVRIDQTGKDTNYVEIFVIEAGESIEFPNLSCII